MAGEPAPLRRHPICRRTTRQDAATVARCLHCAMAAGYVDTRAAQVARLGEHGRGEHEDWMAACRGDAAGGYAPWTFHRWLTSDGWAGYRASDYEDLPEEAA